MTQNNSAREVLYFDSIKEDRDSYFVEYHPAASSIFATLSVVYSGSHDLTAVADTLKAEVAHWLSRYPVPIMAWAYDSADNTIRPNGDIDDGLIVGWYAPGTTTFTYSWKLEGLPPFLNDTSNPSDWRTIYRNLPFRTDAEVKASARLEMVKRRKYALILKVILLFWVAVFPATWATIEYLGPWWLAAVVLLYAFWKAFRAARKLFWPGEPSKSEKEKSEKELKMSHYFYHCELNPEGFNCLKAENFERDARERIRKEAEALKSKNQNK